MRLTCSQKDLAEALNITNHAVDINNTLPVLNNVLLKADGQKLHLSATNLEIAISFWINAEVKNEGEITIPSRLLTSYVNYLDGGDNVDIQIEEGHSLSIHTGNGKTKLKGISSEEFPKIPTVDKEGGFRISTSDFSRLVEQVAFAASMNTTRPILSGVYFGLSKNTIDVVATDSYRLAEKKMKATQVSGEPSCIVPVKTIHQLGHILSVMKKEKEVEVVISKNQILFIIGEVRVVSRLVEGQFPNYKQIIPASSKTRIQFNVSDLALALKRINLFAKENNNKIVFSFRQDGARVTTDTTQYGEGEIVLKNKMTGDDNEIALNSQYLLDVLSSIGAAEVMMGIEGKTSPAVLQAVGDDSYTYIIMPLKM